MITTINEWRKHLQLINESLLEEDTEMQEFENYIDGCFMSLEERQGIKANYHISMLSPEVLCLEFPGLKEKYTLTKVSMGVLNGTYSIMNQEGQTVLNTDNPADVNKWIDNEVQEYGLQYIQYKRDTQE